MILIDNKGVFNINALDKIGCYAINRINWCISMNSNIFVDGSTSSDFLITNIYDEINR
jgi:hypothetical protein